MNKDGLALYATIAIIAMIAFFGCYCYLSNSYTANECDTPSDSLLDVENIAKKKKPSGE